MRRGLLVALVVSACILPLGHEPPRAEAQDAEAINSAIAKGIEALRRLQGQGGIWQFIVQDSEKEFGCTALCALAMLECEVPPNDPAIASAAAAIVRAAPKMKETYVIAFSIMFLDRLGGKTYSAVIQDLARKLIRGQTKKGDWGYTCDTPGGDGWTDNSNTQLAILGLWIARKHNVQVQEQLKRTEQYFRNTQGTDGGWHYNPGQGGNISSPTMTCAGLLGLFLGFGQAKEKEAVLRAAGKGGENKDNAPAAPVIKLDDIRSDPAVVKAMRIVSQYVGTNLQGVGHWLYFVWSIERVCVTYEFEVVNTPNGPVNWYAWASDLLVHSQRRDGSWQADHGPAVDTAFALLVLKKSNLVGKIGQTELRAAGAGKPPPVPGGKEGAGKEVGSTPKVEDDPGKKLAQELIKASATKQSQLIDDYRDRQGGEYSNALAEAIPSLTGGAKDKARIALAERFERLKVDSLRDKMAETNREARLAAAIASGRKGKQELIPDLIVLLKDKDGEVSNAAYGSLKSLSGKSFDKDAAAWEAWWKAKGSK